jgi:hypothetical protein
MGFTFMYADRSKVLEGHGAATRRKVEEGSSERPGSRDFDRKSSPRRRHLTVRRVARTIRWCSQPVPHRTPVPRER